MVVVGEDGEDGEGSQVNVETDRGTTILWRAKHLIPSAVAFEDHESPSACTSEYID
jgi:hypothetical protein